MRRCGVETKTPAGFRRRRQCRIMEFGSVDQFDSVFNLTDWEPGAAFLGTRREEIGKIGSRFYRICFGRR